MNACCVKTYGCLALCLTIAPAKVSATSCSEVASEILTLEPISLFKDGKAIPAASLPALLPHRIQGTRARQVLEVSGRTGQSVGRASLAKSIAPTPQEKLELSKWEGRVEVYEHGCPAVPWVAIHPGEYRLLGNTNPGNTNPQGDAQPFNLRIEPDRRSAQLNLEIEGSTYSGTFSVQIQSLQDPAENTGCALDGHFRSWPRTLALLSLALLGLIAGRRFR